MSKGTLVLSSVSLTAVLLLLSATVRQAGADNNVTKQVESEQKMSDTTAIASSYPFVQAFDSAKTFTGPTNRWIPDEEQPMQAALVARLQSLSDETGRIPNEYLEALASRDCDEVNAFLEAQGLDIRLEPSDLHDAWYAASVLRLLNIKWGRDGQFDATRTSLNLEDQRFDAFKMNAGRHFDQLAVPGSEHPVFELFTDNSDIRVFVTRIEGDLPQGFEAVEMAGRVAASRAPGDDSVEALILPMVNYDVANKLEWLIGMGSTSGYSIEQALMQVIFKMNHQGFSAKVGVAIGASRGMGPVPYVMDGPFLFWVEMKGLTEPLFALPITQEFWEDPGELDG